MAINLKSTGNLAKNGIKLLVYGQAGSGKTTLIKSLPAPIILSAEGGLIAIKDADIPYIEISCMDDLREAYLWLKDSAEAKSFESVALDSISEVAEVVLSNELRSTTKDGKIKDGRAAYGDMNNIMSELIRAFRDLPCRHVYMSAKLEKSSDEMGRMLYNPGMPGKSLTQGLPYFFDEILALRVEKDAEGITQRALLCDPDGLWIAKDRSGKLDVWELPDLGLVINKIIGKTNE